MGVIKQMTREDGDRAVAQWSPEIAAQAQVAEAAFNRLKAEGKAAFVVTVRDGDGDMREGELIHEFDPAAGEIIFTEPMEGG